MQEGVVARVYAWAVLLHSSFKGNLRTSIQRSGISVPRFFCVKFACLVLVGRDILFFMRNVLKVFLLFVLIAVLFVVVKKVQWLTSL